MTAHRTRIAGALTEMPDLIGACFHSTVVCDAVFSPDGRASSHGRTGMRPTCGITSRAGSPPRPCCMPPGCGTSYSPDGKSVATASADGTACVWDSATGAKRYTLKHDGPLTRVAFHPDGKRIATAAEDKTVRMWSACDGKPLDWRLPVGTVIDHLAFSPTAPGLSPPAGIIPSGLGCRSAKDHLPEATIPAAAGHRVHVQPGQLAQVRAGWPAVLSSDGEELSLWAGGGTDTVRTIPCG